MKAEVEKPTEITSRKDRPTGSMHVGDTDFDPDDPAYAMDATWGDVFSACCVKTPQEWLMSFVGFLGVCFFLYFFLVGLDFLGTGAKVMSGCAAGSLFGDDVNPIAGLMVGVLATVLLQSSSTTTSLVISLVGSGVISTKQGIYFIMGANIGTTVTNTLVSCAHLGVADELERAFAGATIHDAFNYLTVAVLLPVEVATGYLFYLTKAMVKNYQSKEGEDWEGPIAKYVEPIGKYVLIENKKVTEAVAKGGSCDEFYPIGE
jgi:solute carrier family 34 (sodium-dependent phosphate cotransporter)